MVDQFQPILEAPDKANARLLRAIGQAFAEQHETHLGRAKNPNASYAPMLANLTASFAAVFNRAAELLENDR